LVLLGLPQTVVARVLWHFWWLMRAVVLLTRLPVVFSVALSA
jgi:hypothetical protein